MTTRRRRAVLNAVPENENCQTTIEGPLSGIMKLIEDLENSGKAILLSIRGSVSSHIGLETSGIN